MIPIETNLYKEIKAPGMVKIRRHNKSPFLKFIFDHFKGKLSKSVALNQGRFWFSWDIWQYLKICCH